MSSDPVTLVARPLLEDLAFPEAPRWHDGRLWFSDMHDGLVRSVDLEGRAATHLAVAEQPSGLGWLPDGSLLVVSMLDRRVLRWDGAALTVHADLAAHAPFHCNDMVVDALGRAYVGNFGFDFEARQASAPTVLLRVDSDGSVTPVARELWFPNGMAITPDGTTLVVGETMANRLSAFTIAADGSLSARRTFAALGERSADGICLDAAGALWVASPVSREVVRVLEGGTVTHRVAVRSQALACMLGGPDGRTLFVLSAPITRRAKSQSIRQGRIECVTVETPRAGRP